MCLDRLRGRLRRLRGVGVVGHPALVRRLASVPPEVVAPYSSYEQAVAAMQDSLPIDGFAEGIDRSKVLVDVCVATGAVSIARMCADYGHRVTLIDPGHPSHFGEPDPEPTASAPTAYSGLLHAG